MKKQKMKSTVNCVYGMLHVYNEDSQESFCTACIYDVITNQIICLTEDLPLPLTFMKRGYGYLNRVGQPQIYITLEELKNIFGGKEI